MKEIILAGVLGALSGAPPTPEYSIAAVRYATLPQFPVSALVVGAPAGETLDIAMVVWLGCRLPCPHKPTPYGASSYRIKGSAGSPRPARL